MRYGLIVQRETLRETCDEVGVADVRFDYSGRGMFGRTCFGFVGSVRDLAAFFYALGKETDEESDDGLGELMANDLRVDDMGRESIFYFPGLELSDPAPSPDQEALDDGVREAELGEAT